MRWSPNDAWHTPIPEIMATLDGRNEWYRMQNGDAEDPQEAMKNRLRGWGR